jgi:hypothetical protein
VACTIKNLHPRRTPSNQSKESIFQLRTTALM